jgi:hypothetical protein
VIQLFIHCIYTVYLNQTVSFNRPFNYESSLPSYDRSYEPVDSSDCSMIFYSLQQQPDNAIEPFNECTIQFIQAVLFTHLVSFHEPPTNVLKR